MFMFDLSDLRTERSQDLYFLLVLAPSEVFRRAVNLFLIRSSPLEESPRQREKPQGKISGADYREGIVVKGKFPKGSD